MVYYNISNTKFNIDWAFNQHTEKHKTWASFWEGKCKNAWKGLRLAGTILYSKFKQDFISCSFFLIKERLKLLCSLSLVLGDCPTVTTMSLTTANICNLRQGSG